MIFPMTNATMTILTVIRLRDGTFHYHANTTLTPIHIINLTKRNKGFLWFKSRFLYFEYSLPMADIFNSFTTFSLPHSAECFGIKSIYGMTWFDILSVSGTFFIMKWMLQFSWNEECIQLWPKFHGNVPSPDTYVIIRG